MAGTRRTMKGPAPGDKHSPVKRTSKIKKPDRNTKRKLKKLAGLIA